MARAAQRVVGTEPVNVGIVKVEADTLFVAFVGQFFQYVTAERSAVHYVVIRFCCVEHGETVVVAGGETNVFGTTGFDRCYPFRCIEFGGVEGCRQVFVFINVQSARVQGPFATSDHAVHSPVDEDTKLIVLEFFTSTQNLRGRFVDPVSVGFGLCNQRGTNQQQTQQQSQ